MKVSKVLLNIASVICFIYGAFYVFSLVFIPIGIYCFIAGRRFSYKAEHLENDMFLSNINFKYYVIFASIACFPLGLITIIPYIMLTSNKISVSSTEFHVKKDNDVEIVSVEESNEENKSEKEEIKPAEVQNDSELSAEEKQEKFNKLQSFRDKGIITDEELELAREQLFGKKQ